VLRVLLATLPLALGAAVSPAVLVAVVALLASGGRRVAAAFVAGAAVFTTVFTFACWLAMRSTVVGVASGAHPRRAATIDLVVGGLLLLWGLVRLVRRRTPKPETARPPRHLGGFAALGFGFVAMATNISSLPLLFVVARLVAHAHLSTGEAVVVLVVDIVVALALAWIPLALAYVAPSASTRILESVHRFLTTHGHTLLTVVLLVLGPYLVVHGLLHL
jgi:hypothetical protein